ncbi:MAG: hypothetical protein LBB54_03835, partial [Cellulomonadaceae bacterium]|nr:hypothetical protein [Cellulomonadaceae bacterium]
YSTDDLAAVSALADSQQVADLLQASRDLVDHTIRTVTIPSFIAGGRLHLGLVSVEDLRGIGN